MSPRNLSLETDRGDKITRIVSLCDSDSDQDVQNSQHALLIFYNVQDTWNQIVIKFSAMQLHRYLKADDFTRGC